MRVIHVSDLHLGFRAYTRLTKQGINQREADVALAFARVVDLIIARRPELVIIAGDVFHHARPGNGAIVCAMTEFYRLSQALPETVVVMVAGNHDTPNTADTGSIFPLFANVPGLYVAERAPQRFRFASLGLSVLAVPDAGHAHPDFAPDAGARYNVMVAHLEVAGVITRHGAKPAAEVPLEALGVANFQYVGVGHYHVHRALAPNANYSGSIEYTSSNVWGELAEERDAELQGKGIVECDLDTGEQRRLHIAPARPLIDCPVIDAAGMSPKDLDDAIQANLVSIDGAVVRQVVRGAERSVVRELDHTAIRSAKLRALHYQLDARKSEPAEPVPSEARKPLASIPDMLMAVLERNRRETPSDVPFERVSAECLRYLGDAEAQEAAKPRERALEQSPVASDVAA